MGLVKIRTRWRRIYGIGFATADQIAQKPGMPRDSLTRVKAERKTGKTLASSQHEALKTVLANRV
jgi:hypothetical protein